MTPAPASPVLAAIVDTPIGPLSLLAQGTALVAAGFTGEPQELHARLRPALRGELTQVKPADLPWLVKPVQGYFSGDLTALDGLAVHQPGTPARQRLWDEMRAVRAGHTVSYAELAARAGAPRAARAAGTACAVNLIAPVIPCHRVLRGDGSLGGYYYGLDRKEWLLRHEKAR
jgi:methylated-DNA-[protein]-cysteine S-methyltransferase